MNVLIIPEDFRNDQYILKPLFSRLFRSISRRGYMYVFAVTLYSAASGKP